MGARPIGGVIVFCLVPILPHLLTIKTKQKTLYTPILIVYYIK